MSQKINFTKENKTRLAEMAGDALMRGTRFKGNLGTEMTIFDLIHNCQINTLSRYYASIKKEIVAIEDLDEWSMTDHQKRKKADLEKQKELINLLIGFKRYTEEQEANKDKVKALKEQYETLKKSTMTPEAQLAELEKELAVAESDVIAD